MPLAIDLEKYKDVQLPTLYQQQIHLTKYSRWNENLNRRETWPETVFRYMKYMVFQAEKFGVELEPQLQTELFEAILNLEVMPSMRALLSAGPALDRDNAAGYNCAYLHINRVEAFDEAMYILMCMAGVGFSVERQYVNQLPNLPESLHDTDSTIVVEDSRIGWAISFRQLLNMLYSGCIPKFDVSKVRPEGAPLKIFGGRASGPGPLVDLFKFTINMFKSAVSDGQKKLTSFQCHSIMCKIGSIVQAGGVRRSALISLSNPSDDRMRHAKTGQWWENNPHFSLANNSAAWTEKPDIELFMKEWMSLIESKSGERGIYNRQAARDAAGRSGRRNTEFDFGINPCSEIILRDRQFCNLTEVVIRYEDDFDSIRHKVELATILGTIQSTITGFRYLSEEWKKNTEEERLLGVSLTGIFDNELMTGKKLFFGKVSLSGALFSFKETAVCINKEWAEKLGINQSTAITCVKPSGTVSQLCNSSSGLHPRHAPYYIRTNRANKIDPVAMVLRDSGIPCENDVMNPEVMWVFSFPQKAPEGAVCRQNLSAIDHLNLWMQYQEHWCEHKPSVTISVRNDEWLEVGAFVYKHFDKMSGVSFLPYSDHNYAQAPYQEISQEEYIMVDNQMPEHLKLELLEVYETDDMTTSAREYSCTGGTCEIL